MKLSTLAILAAINKLEGKVDCLMATVQQLNDKIEALSSESAAALERVAEDFAELKRIIAAGGTISEADLDPAASKVDALLAKFQAVDPEPSFPAPAPPVE